MIKLAARPDLLQGQDAGDGIPWFFRQQVDPFCRV
jgi:hypothetical protein